MTSILQNYVDVIIVGAGPVGLATACLLQLDGLSTLVVDKAENIDQRPRAITLHSSAFELFDRLGLLQDLKRVSLPMDTISFHADDGRTFVGDLRGWGALVDGYLNSLQPSYQSLLFDRALELGAEIRLGTKLTAIANQDDFVVAEVQSTDGLQHRFRGSFIVGADGAASTTRHLAGIPMEAFGLVRTYVLLEGEPICEPPERETGLYVGEKGMVTLSPLPGNRVRIAGPVDEALSVGTSDSVATAALIDALGFGDRLRMKHVDRTTYYSVRQEIAATFTKGRVMLAGDAAHLNAPAGGQGVNLGFADAEAAAWRLANLVRLRSSVDLRRHLDSYSQQRRHAAVQIISEADVFPIVLEIRRNSPSSNQEAQSLLDQRARAWTQMFGVSNSAATSIDPESYIGYKIDYMIAAPELKTTLGAKFVVHRPDAAIDSFKWQTAGQGAWRDNMMFGTEHICHIVTPQWPFPEKGRAGPRQWPQHGPTGFLVTPDRIVQDVAL